MPKTKLSDIFKNGDNFKLKEIDFSSPKIKKEMEETKKQQEEILERKNVDWALLEKTYFTI